MGDQIHSLNENSLVSTFETCAVVPGYKAAIAFNNAKRMEEFINACGENYIPGCRFQRRGGLISNTPSLRFSNSSQIDLILFPTYDAYLRMYHYVMYDEGEYKCNNTTGEDALDAFLNSFEIIQKGEEG